VVTPIPPSNPDTLVARPHVCDAYDKRNHNVCDGGLLAVTGPVSG